MKQSAIGNLYDNLLRFEGIFKNRLDYPIHKKLDFSFSAYPDSEDVSDLIYHKAKSMIDNSSVLDIGCGTGYLLLKFARKHQFEGVGISLSKREVSKAQKSAQKQNIRSLKFKIHDFHNPLDSTFDIVVAIESLKHAVDLKQVARVLFESTLANSTFYIVDDFSLRHHDPGHEKLLKHYWSLKHLFSEKDFVDTFQEAGFKLSERIDLTPHIPVQSLSTINKRMNTLRIIRSSLPDKVFLRRGVEAFLGGTLLDRMYSTGTMQYIMMMFRRS